MFSKYIIQQEELVQSFGNHFLSTSKQKSRKEKAEKKKNRSKGKQAIFFLNAFSRIVKFYDSYHNCTKFI